MWIKRPEPRWWGMLVETGQLLPLGCHCRDCEAYSVCRREHGKTDTSGFCGYFPRQFSDARKTHITRLLEGTAP